MKNDNELDPTLVKDDAGTYIEIVESTGFHKIGEVLAVGGKNPDVDVSMANNLLNSGHGEEVAFDKYQAYQLKLRKKTFDKIGNDESEDDIYSKFIWDDSKIVRKRNFTFLEINKGVAGIGLLLPKDQDIYRKDRLVGSKQIEQPVVITSDRKLLEIGGKFEETEKIKFYSIPKDFTRRFSLPSIKKYLRGEYGKVDGLKLFFRIKKIYEKYLYFANPVWYILHPLWDIGTYFFLLFKVYPIMELRGLKATAKTKIMATSSFMTLNATDIMINPSESALFRETHDKRPTKYIDEAEKLFRFEKGRIISDPRAELINASYFHKGTVPRIERTGNKFVAMYYNVYSPTVIGSINGLYGATEDRALVHITTKPPEGDKRGELDPTDESEDWQGIRDDLYVFLLQNWLNIKKLYNAFDNETSLSNRDFQIYKPLLVLCRYLNESLYSQVRGYAEKNLKMKQHDYISEGSVDYTILRSVRILLGEYGFVHISRIQELFDGEYRPHARTIAKRLDLMGFQDFKDRRHVYEYSGFGYQLNKEIFNRVVANICPSLIFDDKSAENSSPSSPSSQLNIKYENICEGNVNNGEEKIKICEPGEPGERSEDKTI